MQRMISTLMLLSLSVLLTACPLATVPTMERPIQVWNGAPEVGGICRMDSQEVSIESGIPVQILELAMAQAQARGCLSSNDPKFASYACLTFADLKVIHDYIETLIHQCKKWK